MPTKSQDTAVTLRDIAKNLDVSHVTVSLALHNSPQISATRRKQIQDAAVKMGYRPNPMAAALGQLRFTKKARNLTSGIAWINCSESNETVRRYKEFDFYWKGASETAKWFGYNLEEFVCNSDFTMRRLEKVLTARGVHGILIPPHSKLPSTWESFPWNEYSVVRFGHSIPYPRVHLVGSDQVTNSLMAFEKMRAKGYKRIGYASQASNTRHKAGVLLAQSKLAAEQILPQFIVPDRVSEKAVQKQFEKWLKKERPDGILTDVAAVRKMIELAGHNIPGDVGLAVCSVLDGDADAGIYQNPEEIGKSAVEMLISLINHSHIGIPTICRELLIEGEWIDGSTLPSRV